MGILGSPLIRLRIERAIYSASIDDSIGFAFWPYLSARRVPVAVQPAIFSAVLDPLPPVRLIQLLLFNPLSSGVIFRSGGVENVCPEAGSGQTTEPEIWIKTTKLSMQQGKKYHYVVFWGCKSGLLWHPFPIKAVFYPS